MKFWRIPNTNLHCLPISHLLDAIGITGFSIVSRMSLFFQLRLRIGMYHIFISDWIDVFSRDQILVIKTEDMNTANINRVYRQILQFLDIRKYSRSMARISLGPLKLQCH